MKNIIFLILMIVSTFLCTYTYFMHPSLDYFCLCLVDAFLAGCWAMILVEDVKKKRLRDKDE